MDRASFMRSCTSDCAHCGFFVRRLLASTFWSRRVRVRVEGLPHSSVSQYLHGIFCKGINLDNPGRPVYFVAYLPETRVM